MAHYYKRDGSQCYEVERADGKGKRGTNIADARKLGLVPSFSTIIQLLDKPGIFHWRQEQLLNAVIEWPADISAIDQDASYLKDWKKQILTIADKIGKIARERGTEVHDDLEKMFNDSSYVSANKIVSDAFEAIEGIFTNDTWVSEESFCYYGFGGKCDLHSKTGGGKYWSWSKGACAYDTQQDAHAAMNKQEKDHPLSIPYGAKIKEYERGIVIDFKTKDVEDIKKIKPYTENCMQLAAYRMGLGIPHAKCYNFFINVKKPNDCLLYEWKEDELQRTYKMFECLKNYWYLLNKIEQA